MLSDTKKKEKKDLVSEDCLKEDIRASFYNNLVELKPILILDLNYANFEKTCYDTNDLLMKNGYFLRIYELKEIFRYITHDNPKKKNIIRKVSSCIKQKFNGFNIVISQSKNNMKQLNAFFLLKFIWYTEQLLIAETR